MVKFWIVWIITVGSLCWEKRKCFGCKTYSECFQNPIIICFNRILFTEILLRNLIYITEKTVLSNKWNKSLILTVLFSFATHLLLNLMQGVAPKFIPWPTGNIRTLLGNFQCAERSMDSESKTLGILSCHDHTFFFFEQNKNFLFIYFFLFFFCFYFYFFLLVGG